MWYAMRALADWLKRNWNRRSPAQQSSPLQPTSPPPHEQSPAASISIEPQAQQAILNGLAGSLAGNEPYEVVRAKVGAAAGFDGLVPRTPRGLVYPPVIQAIAQAIEEAISRRAPEHDIYEQCKKVIRQQVIDGGLASAEVGRWERVALQTVGSLCMVRRPDDPWSEEARLAYEEVRKSIHGSDSKPTLNPEGDRIVREQREELYWDICQRLASTLTDMREKPIFEIYWLAKSLEKPEPSRAIDVYSEFAARADPRRLGGYVLGAFERISLLHERAREYPKALEAIARYEEMAQEGRRGELWVPKDELMTIQKRKVRILARLAGRSEPTRSTEGDGADRAP